MSQRKTQCWLLIQQIIKTTGTHHKNIWPSQLRKWYQILGYYFWDLWVYLLRDRYSKKNSTAVWSGTPVSNVVTYSSCSQLQLVTSQHCVFFCEINFSDYHNSKTSGYLSRNEKLNNISRSSGYLDLDSDTVGGTLQRISFINSLYIYIFSDSNQR